MTFHFGRPKSPSAVVVDYDSGVAHTHWSLSSAGIGGANVDSQTVRLRFKHGGTVVWQNGRLDTN